MQAERERIAKRYRAEGDEKALETRAAADKQREIILATAYSQSQIQRGEGDARAAAITAQAFSQDAEFYALVRRLQVYETILGAGRRSCCRRNRICCATWNRRSLCHRLTPGNGRMARVWAH